MSAFHPVHDGGSSAVEPTSRLRAVTNPRPLGTLAPKRRHETVGAPPQWGLSGEDRVQVPSPRDALEFVLSAVLELDTRAGNEVGHRARDEYLPRASER